MRHTHHYLYEANSADAKQFKLVLFELDILRAKHRPPIADGHGQGEPVIAEGEIWINGIGDDACETFYFQVGETTGNDFCKTRQLPYDFFVMLCLLSLATHIKGFTITKSDGNFKDWSQAIAAYGEVNPIQPSVLAFLGTPMLVGAFYGRNREV